MEVQEEDRVHPFYVRVLGQMRHCLLLLLCWPWETCACGAAGPALLLLMLKSHLLYPKDALQGVFLGSSTETRGKQGFLMQSRVVGLFPECWERLW